MVLAEDISKSGFLSIRSAKISAEESLLQSRLHRKRSGYHCIIRGAVLNPSSSRTLKHVPETQVVFEIHPNMSRSGAARVGYHRLQRSGWLGRCVALVGSITTSVQSTRSLPWRDYVPLAIWHPCRFPLRQNSEEARMRFVPSGAGRTKYGHGWPLNSGEQALKTRLLGCHASLQAARRIREECPGSIPITKLPLFPHMGIHVLSSCFL